MKAIRVSSFGDPSVLQCVAVPELRRGPGQVLVRLHAAGVNPVEAYIRAGKYPKLPALPYTPGADGAGVVEEADVPEQAGKRVYVNGSLTGTYVEKALCTPEQVHPLSDHSSFEQGAALGVPYGTASWALFYRGRIRAGETLLVHGASGGVGLAALQLARGEGRRIFGTAGTADGLELILKNGADAAFNHREPDYLEKIESAAGEHGIDIILEMLANQNLGHDLTLLAPGGRVVVIGSRGPVEIDPRNMMMRETDIRGITLFGAKPDDLADIHRRIVAGLSDGLLDPVIGKAFPLAEAARAHEEIMGSGARGKIVLTM